MFGSFFQPRNGNGGNGAVAVQSRSPQAAPRHHVRGNRPMPKLTTLGPSSIAVVSTHGSAKVLCPLTNASNPALHMAVASLHQHMLNASGTNYADALRVALDLLEPIPDSLGKHIYLVADGADNTDRDKLDGQIERARRMHVRVYTIPIGSTQAGHEFDCDRMFKIAVRTGGNLKSMSKLKELAEHFEQLAAKGGHHLGRAVAKVLIADVSPSMAEQWDRTTKIDALKFALIRFLQIEAKRQ